MGSFKERHLPANGNNFLGNIRNMMNNTLKFENISYKEIYKNPNIEHMEETEKRLVYFRNILQEKYLNRIMSKRRTTVITAVQKLEFDMNPYLAAHDLLGDSAYWWIILLVNKKMCVEDFTKLGESIYTPDMEDLKECISIELTKNKNIGVLEE